MYFIPKGKGPQDAVMVNEAESVADVKEALKQAQYDSTGVRVFTPKEFNDMNTKATTLRTQGKFEGAKANELAKNPRMQPEQINGPVDALGIGLSRFMFPVASDIAERGGSENEINASASMEAPSLLMLANPMANTFGNAVKQGAVYGASNALARFAGGDEVNPVETGLAAAGPLAIGALPRMGANAGAEMVKMAPNILHSSVVPKSGMMKGANPPDFEFALQQEGLIPMGGTMGNQIEGMERGIENNVKRISGEREAIPAWSKGTPINIINGVFKNAEQAINNERMTVPLKKAVRTELAKLRNDYAEEWGSNWKSVGDAMDERSKLGSESKAFVTDAENVTAKKKAQELLAREIGNYVENVSPEVMAKTREMAPWMSLKNPVENAADNTRSKTLIPLGYTQAAIAGGMAAGPIGMGAGLLAANLSKTPAGAKRIYDLGRFMAEENPETLSPIINGGSRLLQNQVEGKKRKLSDYGK